MGADIHDFWGRRVYMIGIGGSSMSGLAELLKKRGCEVSGSDKSESPKTLALKDKGFTVYTGHNGEQVRGSDIVIYSAAISPENPEIIEANRLNIPTMERSVLLGQIMRDYPRSIAVCGAHGKTTTTSMLALAMLDAKIDPTIHIGGDLPLIGGGTILGNSEYFLTEACEFHGSFLQLNPQIITLLNIDNDHLDYYGTMDNLIAAFRAFLARLPKNGTCVTHIDDKIAMNLASECGNVVTFGLNSGDWRTENLTYDSAGCAQFSAVGAQRIHVALNVPGEYSVLNALATIATLYAIGVNLCGGVAASLSRFRNAHRRFEKTGIIDKVNMYHDYGHHPTEIKNVLKVAKMQPHNTLWAVWQPHTFSRTKILFYDFIETFDDADRVIITDIFAAREIDDGTITTEMLLPHYKKRGIKVDHAPTFDDTEAFLRKHWQPGDLVITLGCGNINELNIQMHGHGDTSI